LSEFFIFFLRRGTGTRPSIMDRYGPRCQSHAPMKRAPFFFFILALNFCPCYYPLNFSAYAAVGPGTAAGCGERRSSSAHNSCVISASVTAARASSGPLGQCRGAAWSDPADPKPRAVAPHPRIATRKQSGGRRLGHVLAAPNVTPRPAFKTLCSRGAALIVTGAPVRE